METRRLNGFENRLNRLMGHLGTLLLAVILALIVWLIAITQQNPIVEEQFSEPVPVKIVGLSQNLQPLQDLSNRSVSIRVRTAQDIFRGLTIDNFEALIDLTGKGIGTHDVAIHVSVNLRDVSITAVDEQFLQIHLDRVITKTVPVRVEVLDGAAYGYSWAEPIADPAEVLVSGPARQVQQVSHGQALINLYNANMQVQRSQVVSPRNDQNESVAQVSVVPATVQVVVPITPWPGRKEVAMCFNQVGQPASGYRLSAVKFTPSTVVLLGDNELLNQIPCVETEPFSLEGATTDVQQRLNLILPEGVTSLEWNSVQVAARITAVEGGITVKRRPVLREVGEGLTARPALDTVDVILSGPQPMLQALTEDDARVILNLSGLLPGTHTVRPTVELPEGIVQEGVLPETVEVIITGPPTPAPSGSREAPSSTSTRQESALPTPTP